MNFKKREKSLKSGCNLSFCVKVELRVYKKHDQS